MKKDIHISENNPDINASYSTNNKKHSYLALGDSYTIGESVTPDKRFPVQLANRLGQAELFTNAPSIVAKTGWTTDELAAAIKNRKLEKKYDLVTLLIGVNNQYRGRDTSEYRIQFTDLLKTSVAFTGGNPENLIVISIPDYGVTPFGLQKNPIKIAKEIDAFNQINYAETIKAGANYVDITSISRKAQNNANLIASDGLHPSGEMYFLWVEEIFPVAKKIILNQ